jgi:DNA polymerase I-like protein with 3'-5' exonuclease and polymerase domains
MKTFTNHCFKSFNVPLEEVTREQRSHAKTVNFGIIYGVSALDFQTKRIFLAQKALL